MHITKGTTPEQLNRALRAILTDPYTPTSEKERLQRQMLMRYRQTRTKQNAALTRIPSAEATKAADITQRLRDINQTHFRKSRISAEGGVLSYLFQTHKEISNEVIALDIGCALSAVLSQKIPESEQKTAENPDQQTNPENDKNIGRAGHVSFNLN